MGVFFSKYVFQSVVGVIIHNRLGGGVVGFFGFNQKLAKSFGGDVLEVNIF